MVIKPKYKIGDTLIRTVDGTADKGHIITVGNILIYAPDIYYIDIKDTTNKDQHHESFVELHQPTKRNISIKDIQCIAVEVCKKTLIDFGVSADELNIEAIHEDVKYILTNKMKEDSEIQIHSGNQQELQMHATKKSIEDRIRSMIAKKFNKSKP